MVDLCKTYHCILVCYTLPTPNLLEHNTKLCHHHGPWGFCNSWLRVSCCGQENMSRPRPWACRGIFVPLAPIVGIGDLTLMLLYDLYSQIQHQDSSILSMNKRCFLSKIKWPGVKWFESFYYIRCKPSWNIKLFQNPQFWLQIKSRECFRISLRTLERREVTWNKTFKIGLLHMWNLRISVIKRCTLNQ